MSRSKSCGTFTQSNAMQPKEERISTFCDSIDGTGKYYAKCNMPVSEEQMSYDLKYRRNIRNNINKQNRTRGIETKNSLTVTRGEG